MAVAIYVQATEGGPLDLELPDSQPLSEPVTLLLKSNHADNVKNKDRSLGYGVGASTLTNFGLNILNGFLFKSSFMCLLVQVRSRGSNPGNILLWVSHNQHLFLCIHAQQWGCWIVGCWLA